MWYRFARPIRIRDIPVLAREFLCNLEDHFKSKTQSEDTLNLCIWWHPSPWGIQNHKKIILTCHTHTHARTHCTHNQILCLCKCCHGPTLQPPIFPPALLYFLCSQTAHQHVQVLSLGSLAWQEACFQSFALFFPFLFFSFLFTVFFFCLYQCWLITGTFSSCPQRAAAVERLPASPTLLFLSSSPFAANSKGGRGEGRGTDVY